MLCLNILLFALFHRNSQYFETIAYYLFICLRAAKLEKFLKGIRRTVNILTHTYTYIRYLLKLEIAINQSLNVHIFTLTYLKRHLVNLNNLASQRETGNRKRESGIGNRDAAVEEALALSTLDRGTVKFNKTTIKVRAKQKTHTVHFYTHTHSCTRARRRRCVGVSVGGCSFCRFYLFLPFAFSVFLLCEARACAKNFLKAAFKFISPAL